MTKWHLGYFCHKRDLQLLKCTHQAAWLTNLPLVFKVFAIYCKIKAFGKLAHLSQIELWFTFNSSFYLCQAIRAHYEERVWHMNLWAWEITISRCSLTHFVPGAMWKSSAGCVYSFKWCLSCKSELNITTFWLQVRRHRRVICMWPGCWWVYQSVARATYKLTGQIPFIVMTHWCSVLPASKRSGPKMSTHPCKNGRIYVSPRPCRGNRSSNLIIICINSHGHHSLCERKWETFSLKKFKQSFFIFF